MILGAEMIELGRMLNIECCIGEGARYRQETMF